MCVATTAAEHQAMSACRNKYAKRSIILRSKERTTLGESFLRSETCTSLAGCKYLEQNNYVNSEDVV